MSTLFNSLKAVCIKKNHKNQVHCKQDRREHSGASAYKVFPVSNLLSVWPPDKPAGAHEGMINPPVRPRHQGHPSLPGISISEQHSCHFCIENKWLDFSEGSMKMWWLLSRDSLQNLMRTNSVQIGSSIRMEGYAELSWCHHYVILAESSENTDVFLLKAAFILI